MPELPEIETIKLELNSLIKGKKIKSVEVKLAKQIIGSKDKFIKQVVDKKVIGLNRRAKTLIIDLTGNLHLVFHLKMTGQLIYSRNTPRRVLAGGGHPIQQDLKSLPNKYSHVIFNFSDGSHLFFNDLRQFGWVKLVTDKELEKMDAEFGPEPLDKKFTFSVFKEKIKPKKSPIKPLLMDQKFLAGVGNIYAQEACFCASVKPTRPANKISEAELKKLYNCLRKILKFAVLKKGTSADAYVDAFGRQGNMMNYLKVYGQAGQPCKKCKTHLKQIRQAQRSTVFCPKCQK